MKVVCCRMECRKEYDIGENIYYSEKTNRPILKCPHCGYEHIIDFIPLDKEVESRDMQKMKSIDLGPYYVILYASRIADKDRADQSGTDDGNVTNWNKSDEFILATAFHTASKAVSASRFKLQWRDVTDTGSFADVTNTGEITYVTTDTVLSDGTDVVYAEHICSDYGGDTWQNGLENENDNESPDSPGTYTLAEDYYTEFQWALDCSGADDNHVYEFQVVDEANSVTIGTCGCTIQMAAAAQEQSKTFTIDSYLKKELSDTVTIDGYLKNELSETFTIDSWLAKETDKTLTIDGYLAKTDIQETFTIDAYLQELDIQKTFTIDTYLVFQQYKTFTVDAYLAEDNVEKTFTIDARLLKEQPKAFTIDTYLVFQQTKTFTIDTYLEKGIIKTHTIDSYLSKADIQKTVTIDGYLSKEFSETFTIDSRLLKEFTKTLTIDSYLVKSLPKTLTVDAYLVKELEKTVTIDSYLQKQFQKAVTIDTYVSKDNVVKTFTIDGWLEPELGPEEKSKTFTIDAIIDHLAEVYGEVIIVKDKTYIKIYKDQSEINIVYEP